MKARVGFATVCLLTSSCALSGCSGGSTTRSYSVAVNGNARQGKEVIQAYGCGACHIIPGIYDARGLVGPPLTYFGERTMIAGELPNVPSNLVRWVENPVSIEPHTAMPDLGLSETQAEDVAAYLYTLR